MSVSQIRPTDPSSRLLDLAAQVREGSIVGITVVVIQQDGTIKMETLTIPPPRYEFAA